MHHYRKIPVALIDAQHWVLSVTAGNVQGGCWAMDRREVHRAGLDFIARGPDRVCRGSATVRRTAGAKQAGFCRMARDWADGWKT